MCTYDSFKSNLLAYQQNRIACSHENIAYLHHNHAWMMFIVRGYFTHVGT